MGHAAANAMNRRTGGYGFEGDNGAGMQNGKYQLSNIKYQISNIKYQMSALRRIQDLEPNKKEGGVGWEG